MSIEKLALREFASDLERILDGWSNIFQLTLSKGDAVEARGEQNMVQA
jgi:hypothetical protein